MTSYSGRARLILADGTRVLGTASLSSNRAGRAAGWGGTFRPDQTTAEVKAAEGSLQLELPYSEITGIDVTGSRRLLATQILMSLTGRGPAPF